MYYYLFYICYFLESISLNNIIMAINVPTRVARATQQSNSALLQRLLDDIKKLFKQNRFTAREEQTNNRTGTGVTERTNLGGQ